MARAQYNRLFRLNDEQAVKLTVANYMTAAGKQIDEIGVEPDVTLSGSENTWEQQALELCKSARAGFWHSLC